MPAPSTILDRPEFAVLRYLDADELRRLGAVLCLCERSNPYECPLAKATGRTIDSPDAAAEWLAHSGAEEDALIPIIQAFIDAWDGEHMSYGELDAAVLAALAEKEAADARP